MLHTINKSPFDKNSLADCVRFIAKDDVVLLLEDGVYAAAANTTKSSLVSEILKSNKVYAMQVDLKARAIDNLVHGIEAIDYEKFVDLVEAHQVNAWL